MNLLKRIIITAAGAAMATGLLAGAAGASTHDPFPFPAAATTFVFTPNVPGGGGPWASSWVWRQANVNVTFSTPVAVSPWNCGWTGGWTGGPPPPPCFAFTAFVTDSGSFTTHRHALTPNQGFPFNGRRIKGTVHGNVSGFVSFGTFFATTAPNSALVPRFYFDSTGFSVLSWPKMFFPAGTTFGVHPSYFSFTYSALTRCGFQRWNANSFTLGQGPFSGNITGCRFFY